MVNHKEAAIILKDAKASLQVAQKNLPLGEFRTTIQNSQMAIEGAAKAVISCFASPEWEHNPSDQLREVVKQQEEAIIKKMDKDMLTSLLQLADDSGAVSQWHIWSVYGRRDEETGERLAAVDICNEKDAKELLEIAKRAILTAGDFIKNWFD